MLLLDAGNTRLKWAFVRDGGWLRQGAAEISALGSLRRAFADLPEPARILASNVAGDGVAQQLRAACAVWKSKVEFISAAREQCGVRNGYRRPEQLGSDRWAALIAAWSRQQAACLVVNCGTATTVDALSAGGEFLGGLILPGLDMMRESLASGTAQLRAAAGNWEDFPRDTADAIFSGAVKATVGAIMQQHVLLRAPQAPCLLGGGAAAAIEGHLGVPVVHVEDMVLHGLQLIAQETGRVSDE
jgi:type III pantothenate kinase